VLPICFACYAVDSIEVPVHIADNVRSQHRACTPICSPGLHRYDRTWLRPSKGSSLPPRRGHGRDGPGPRSLFRIGGPGCWPRRAANLRRAAILPACPFHPLHASANDPAYFVQKSLRPALQLQVCLVNQHCQQIRDSRYHAPCSVFVYGPKTSRASSPLPSPVQLGARTEGELPSSALSCWAFATRL